MQSKAKTKLPLIGRLSDGRDGLTHSKAKSHTSKSRSQTKKYRVSVSGGSGFQEKIGNVSKGSAMSNSGLSNLFFNKIDQGAFNLLDDKSKLVAL